MNFFKKYQTKYPKNPVANAYDSLPTDDIVRRRYHFTGTVQGVGFRVEMWRRAINMKLAGWVKNNEDGSVDAELEGPKARIDALISQMESIPRIRIQSVDVQTLEPVVASDFEMLNY